MFARSPLQLAATFTSAIRTAIGHRTMSASAATATDPPTLSQVVSVLNRFAPLQLAESWDNVGLLIEPSQPRPIRTILLTNDLTEAVMAEAIEARTDLIISYHPPIFKPLTRITQANWKERIVAKCLGHHIALYSPHTAWDAVPGGVNDWLAQFLDAEAASSRPCQPHASDPERCGAGRLLQLGGEAAQAKEPLTLGAIVERFKRHINVGKMNVAVAAGHTLQTPIAAVAVCAGSGASVLRGVAADLYITGEMSHHDVLDAVHLGRSVIACNHSNSERGFLGQFAGKLGALLAKEGGGGGGGEVQVLVAKSDADPLVVY